MTLPSKKVTVPVGDPAPGATADTVAVNVTGWPVPVGLIDGLRATVVAARLTVSVTNADLLGAKALLPTKEAVSECTPTPSDRVSVAWPAVLTGAVPSTVLRSLKMTVPVGVPAGEFTVAVSVTGWPKTAIGADVRRVVVVTAPACARSSRPIRLPAISVNQRLPSAPTAIPPGAAPGAMPAENSLSTPAVVMRPIWLRPGSVNQRLPSGPAVICRVTEPAVVPPANSVTWPAGVIRPIRL